MPINPFRKHRRSDEDFAEEMYASEQRICCTVSVCD